MLLEQPSRSIIEHHTHGQAKPLPKLGSSSIASRAVRGVGRRRPLSRLATLARHGWPEPPTAHQGIRLVSGPASSYTSAVFGAGIGKALNRGWRLRAVNGVMGIVLLSYAVWLMLSY